MKKVINKMTAKTVRSRKAKGFTFQKEVAEMIRSKFGLEDRDVCSTPSSVPGVDILLSNRAKELFPFAVETKRTEKVSMWDWIKQAEQNRGELTPLVVFKRNRSDTYCCLKFDDLLEIIHGSS